jgi:hypothetical protein
MASQRMLIVTLFATLYLTLVAAIPNDLTVGAREPGDFLLQREHVEKEESYLGKVVTVTKTLPGDGVSRITQIKALDQHQNGYGAHASIIAGGIGQSYVTIKFESERFRSIDFIIDLYGK